MEQREKQEVLQKSSELKEETINTVRNVKESVKSINFKEETEKSKGYLKELVENPVSKMKSIAKDKDNVFFKTAILALILWMAVELIDMITAVDFDFSYLFDNIIMVLKTLITPVVSVIVLSVVIFLMNKENKKSLNCVITTVVTAKVPVILGDVIGLLSIISSSAYKLTNPISSILQVVSTVLLFFGIKYLFEIKEENDGVKKFAIVMTVFYIARFLISFLGIYI